MQKIFPDRFLKRFLGRAVSPEFDFDSSEFGVMEPKMSGYAKKLLFCELKNIERYAYQRRLNANVFSECFATALPILRYTVPYQYHAVLPLESARRIYAKIANANLYVQRWADIPKEIFADRDKHACAIDFAERSVFLPLHQDINEKHIFESYYKFRTVSHEYKTRVVNDELLWNKLLSKSKYSNLLLSWGYGETKLTSGWIVKRLLITDIDDNEVAICQALLKSFFGVGVVRINRGPILLDEAADKEALLCLLKKKLSLGIVTIFFAAFEFFDGPGVRFVLNRCGFWCRRIRGWSSGWIGLDVDMDHIRNAFDSKWRNQLKSAEHKNIIIVTVKNKDGYEEFITRYERFMIDRSFDGIRPDALRFLVNKYPSSLTAFEAFLDGVFYGGVLLHLHGRCATYLVGISSEEGRKTNTMNLLLWYAVAELKKRGFSSFDLGGIDTVATPSIAKFKRGLSPKEYTLTGEYVGFRFSLFASCGEGQ